MLKLLRLITKEDVVGEYDSETKKTITLINPKYIMHGFSKLGQPGVFLSQYMLCSKSEFVSFNRNVVVADTEPDDILVKIYKDAIETATSPTTYVDLRNEYKGQLLNEFLEQYYPTDKAN